MELSAAQRQAAELVAEGLKYGDVAARLNITRQTLWHWMKISEFKTELSANEDAALEDSRRQFGQLREQAIAAFRGILERWDEMPAAAVRAATIVLQNAAVIEDRGAELRTDSDVVVKWAELKNDA